MTDQKFSPDESLQLIRSMIEKTKDDISGNSIYFLMWGWAVFLACIAQYILKVVFDSRYHYHVWWITLILFASTLLIERKGSRKKKVKTYLDESMGVLWMGMGISFF